VTELVTERLVLRPLQAADLPALTAYRSDPEVARYQSWEPSFSLADAQELLETQGDRRLGRAGDGWVDLMAVDRGDGTVHGDVAALVHTDARATAEVGVTFARSAQGRGLATEALGALVDELFRTHGMHRVHAETDERNPAVHRLLERLGFRCEGVLVDADWCKGEWVSLRLFAVLEREWVRP
jgi:aminoglycoside 6'-N-acetyltransferase